MYWPHILTRVQAFVLKVAFDTNLKFAPCDSREPLSYIRIQIATVPKRLLQIEIAKQQYLKKNGAEIANDYVECRHTSQIYKNIYIYNICNVYMKQSVAVNNASQSLFIVLSVCLGEKGDIAVGKRTQCGRHSSCLSIYTKQSLNTINIHTHRHSDIQTLRVAIITFASIKC